MSCVVLNDFSWSAKGALKLHNEKKTDVFGKYVFLRPVTEVLPQIWSFSGTWDIPRLKTASWCPGQNTTGSQRFSFIITSAGMLLKAPVWLSNEDVPWLLFFLKPSSCMMWLQPSQQYHGKPELCYMFTNVVVHQEHFISFQKLYLSMSVRKVRKCFFSSVNASN